MDENILKIMNDELIELRKMSSLAQKRLDLHSEEFKKRAKKYDEQSRMLEKQGKMLDKHSKVLDKHTKALTNIEENQRRHQAAVEVLYKNMVNMEERLVKELN